MWYGLWSLGTEFLVDYIGSGLRPIQDFHRFPLVAGYSNSLDLDADVVIERDPSAYGMTGERAGMTSYGCLQVCL